MRKYSLFSISIFSVFFLSIFSISILSIYEQKKLPKLNLTQKEISHINNCKNQNTQKLIYKNSNVKLPDVKVNTISNTSNSKISNKTSNNERFRPSRGGNPPSNLINSSNQNIQLLDWENAKKIFDRNCVAIVTDVYTNKSFNVKRTMGSNHADTESLSLKDTNIIKSIWGGFSWTRRPVIIHINGKHLAASMSAMPHAGIDNAPAFEIVNNRSCGYGRGENLDVIKNNGMDGHFDIHFLNSTRHMDGKKDPQHQNAIKIAAKQNY